MIVDPSKEVHWQPGVRKCRQGEHRRKHKKLRPWGHRGSPPSLLQMGGKKAKDKTGGKKRRPRKITSLQSYVGRPVFKKTG